MHPILEPRLEILPPPQRRLWDELNDIPTEFVLWGGTAVALHLGHRQSVDFDFFSDAPVDFDAMLRSLPMLRDCKVTSRSAGTLNCIVDREGDVKLSFFAVPGVLKSVNPSLTIKSNGLRVASLLDLAAMKVKVVQDRAEAKDYIDIDAILQQGDITLGQALRAAEMVYGPSFAVSPSVKALAYFGDGNLDTVPEAAQRRLKTAVRGVDPMRLPSLKRTIPEGRDRSR